MRVCVLGPLEISDGGETQRVGAAKQRGLLAALVVRAGTPVPVERLVEELWDGPAPASAVNLIQGYVGALRRAMGDRDGALLRTQAPGYRLVLSDDELDVRRFETLTARGRRALGDGDCRLASELLVEAQRLWRGEPFTDVPATPAVRTETDRLEQLRLAALEARIDADLRLGRGAELVPELQMLTAAHPWLERFWAQLMVTLCRCGRQAEALAAYRQLYRLLDDKLGVEPSPQVRELHQQILAGDPSPGTGPVQPAHVERLVVPRQLPAGISDFTGRLDLLARLDALLPDDTDLPAAVVISAITGTAGVGKTALAVHWAHQIAGRFPNGQLYVNLRGFDPIGRAVDASEAVRGFLDALGVPAARIPNELEDQAALYRSLLADRRLLVVLDNARDAEQVRPLLPGSPGCLVLITSRNRLESLITAEAARPVQVDLLSTEEAHHLLAARLGTDRVAAEPEAVNAIVTSCARLPLALTIVAARAATHPHFSLAALAAELDAAQTSLEPFAATDTVTDLRAVFSWSYRQLNPDAQRLFRLLGLHPGPDITAPASASLAGQPLTTVRRVLSDLCRAHLLAEHLPGRYTFHDLLRAYAAELTDQADGEADRHTAVHRMLDHYLHTARVASRLYNPGLISLDRFAAPSAGVAIEHFADTDQAGAWFAAELPVLLEIARLARQRGLDRYTWRLAGALTDYLNRQGQWRVQLAIQRAGLEAALRLGDVVGQMRTRRGLAFVLIQLGRNDEADSHLRETLELAREVGDPEELANTHHGLAFAARRRGRIDLAVHHKEQSEQLLRTVGHPEAHAIALTDAGWYHALAGHYDKALDYGHRALTLVDTLDYRHGEALATHALGYAHHHLGRHDKAAAYYERALHAARAANDREIEATVLDHVGDNHAAIGDHDAALGTWRQTLDIFDELGHQDAETVRGKLESLAITTGRPRRVPRDDSQTGTAQHS